MNKNFFLKIKFLVFSFITGIFILPNLVFAQAINLPNDQAIGSQLWYYQMTNIDDAWSVIAGDPNLVIAVIDDGIDMQHPDLIGNIWRNTDEVIGNGKDDDNNGYIDDFYGWDFSSSSYGPIQEISYFPGVIKDRSIELWTDLLDELALSWYDLTLNAKRFILRDSYFNHGTPVAAFIGAKGNNVIDLSGILWNVQLMNLPRYELYESTGSTSDTAAAAAIDYAVNNGAKIINISSSFIVPGGATEHPTYEAALKRAYESGVVVIVAAGNGDSSGNPYNTSQMPIFPACSQYVLAVGAVDAQRNRASFSNYGNCVDVWAPGANIATLYYGYDVIERNPYDPNSEDYITGTRTYIEDAGTLNNYQFLDGTSFAAPIVAGIAGMLKSKNPFATPQQIYDRIKSTSTLPIIYPSNGGSIVDAYAALTAGPIGPQIENGSIFQSTGSSSVYVFEDNKAHLIPDIATFNARRFVSSTIQQLTPEQWSSVPFGDMLLPEGALIRATGDLDVYIVKYMGNKKFKRLVLSPSVFNSYGHLKWDAIQTVTTEVRDSFTTSDLVRTVGDDKVWRLVPNGDIGERRWISTAAAFTRLQLDSEAIYEINVVDQNSYVERENIQ